MKGEWVFVPEDKLPGRRHRWTEALEDPSSGELSVSRIGTAWCLFVLAPALIALVCLDLFPADGAVKLILGLLAAPALVYGMNSAAGAWRREKRTAPEPTAKCNPPDLATGAATVGYE